MQEAGANDVVLRPLTESDAQRIVDLVHDSDIWLNVKDSFPKDYQISNALDFIAHVNSIKPVQTLAVEYQNLMVGAIGLSVHTDIYRFTAELGYWIGPAYRENGIATLAVNHMVEYGFNVLKLIRIYSCVFETNKASQRVLEKSGFRFETIFEKAIVKNGKLLNEFRYSKINPHYKSIKLT